MKAKNIFLYKTNVFFTFSILVLFYDYGSKKAMILLFFFSILELFYDYGPIKPMVFHFFDFSIVLRLRVYKTNGFFTFSIFETVDGYWFNDPFFQKNMGLINKIALFYNSLNSLAVRVPHNISRRALQMHGPNPLMAQKGAFSLQFFEK